MIDIILGYAFVGFVWMGICDFLILRFPDNATRMRYFLFWPVSLGAFIYGVIQYFFMDNNE